MMKMKIGRGSKGIEDDMQHSKSGAKKFFFAIRDDRLGGAWFAQNLTR
jgi:hypothetical protein